MKAQKVRFITLLTVALMSSGVYLSDKLAAAPPPEPVDAVSVMGFEKPGEWSSQQATETRSDVVSQGHASLAVIAGDDGFPVELRSVAVSTPPEVGPSLGFDLMLPPDLRGSHQSVCAAMFLSSRTLGLHDRFIGKKCIKPDPVAEWRTVTFALDAALADSLKQRYDDLRFVIVLNVPPRCCEPLRVDHLRFNPRAISVSTDRSEVCAGEDVLVEADADVAEVLIDGLPGPRRYLEFQGAPGPRHILVSARGPDGNVDSRVQIVTVLDCGTVEQFPVLATSPSAFQPYQVEFLVSNASALGLDPGATYTWAFGDGEVQTTTTPFVSHSYAASLPAEQELATFQAEVRISGTAAPNLTSNKTVTVFNPYAFNRARGTLTLPVDTTRSALRRMGQQFEGGIRITNPEDTAVALTEQQLEFQPCEGGIDPITLPPTVIDLFISGRSQASRTLTISIDELSGDVCGVAVHLRGQGLSGITALADAYFDLPSLSLTIGSAPVSPEMNEILRSVTDQGLVDDPDRVSREDLRRLELEGKITLPPPPVDGEAETNLVTVAQVGDPPAPGAECDPSEPARPGLSCEPTGDFVEDQAPRVANALKGDLLLHAECNFIGSVLRELNPPQSYTHEAIMTANYFELRHHTSAEGWYFDHRNTLTVKSDFLQFGWPGSLDIMTMTIQDAFFGRTYLDPEGHARTVSAINLKSTGCVGDLIMSPPLVVKPSHEGFTPEVRERLERAADLSKQIHGHYRFFGFSDGSIALNAQFNAPAQIEWAAGTVAAVSSTFIWTALHQAGVKLEGGLSDGPEDAEDIRNGADIDDQTLDGQYRYEEEERRAGLESLNAFIERKVREGADWFVPGDLAAQAQYSDQIPNCFAHDRCSETDEGWQKPGIGRTTSPKNFLFWDKPKYGGSYGYSELLVFRAGGLRRVHRWVVASPTTGRVEVTVVRDQDGAPVENATVVLMGLGQPTDGLGRTTFEAIPQGTHQVEARKSFDNPPQAFVARTDVVVSAGQTTSVTLRIRPELNLTRLVNFIGDIVVEDDELVFDESQRYPVQQFCRVSPAQREDGWTFRACLDDEVVAQVVTTCRLLANAQGQFTDRVSVNMLMELHESTGCGDERQDHEDRVFELDAGQSQRVNVELRNRGFFGGDDTATFNFNVSNLQATP